MSSSGTEGGAVCDTAVVIVNYRTPDLTLTATQSVLDEPGVREVVVVDNASDDGSAEFLRGALSDLRVKVVESSTNIGFGQGANLGVQQSAAPFVFLLNSDAVLRRGSLEPLVRLLRERAEVAVVAPTIYCSHGNQLQPAAYGAFPTPMSLLAHRTRPRSFETLTPDWISGVAMLVRRSDFERVGGFDPDFVMYFEDVDLCRRLRAMGQEVRRELTAGVDHLVGRSWADADDQCRQAQAGRVTYSQKAGYSSPGKFAIRTLQAAHLHWHRFSPRKVTGLPARWLQQ